VARGADPCDSTRPMTIDQVANVRGLARMHSQYWDHRLTEHPALGWVEPFVAFGGLFLQGSLTIEDRRASERGLLEDTVRP